MPEIRNYTLNFGPQHPSAHSVLRLMDWTVKLLFVLILISMHRGTKNLLNINTLANLWLHGSFRLRLYDV